MSLVVTKHLRLALLLGAATLAAACGSQSSDDKDETPKVTDVGNPDDGEGTGGKTGEPLPKFKDIEFKTLLAKDGGALREDQMRGGVFGLIAAPDPIRGDQLQTSCSSVRHTTGSFFASVLTHSCALFETAGTFLYGDAQTAAIDDGSICDQEPDAMTPFVAAMCAKQIRDAKDVERVVLDGAPRGVVAADFTAPSGSTAAGKWNPSTGSAFPASLVFWGGASAAAAQPSFYLDLKSQELGTLGLWIESAAGLVPLAKTYVTATAQADCAKAAAAGTCLEQEISVDFGDGKVQTSPNSMHVRLLADSAVAPTFMLAEGLYTIDAANAKWLSEKAWEDGPVGETLFENGRTLYFQVVRAGGEIWGRLVIRDADGKIVDGYGSAAGKGPELADPKGHCLPFYDTGASPGLFDYADCKTFDPTPYQAAFRGEDGLKSAHGLGAEHLKRFATPPAQWQ